MSGGFNNLCYKSIEKMFNLCVTVYFLAFVVINILLYIPQCNTQNWPVLYDFSLFNFENNSNNYA